MFIKSRDLFVKKWNEKNDLDINRFLEYFGAQWVNDVVVVITELNSQNQITYKSNYIDTCCGIFELKKTKLYL